MIGVVPALNACEGEHSRGFTFVGARGPGKDLFVSFHDLRLATQRRAAHYAAAGIGRGDRVALVVPEGEQFIPAFLGALWGGLIPVPLYPPVSLGKLDAFMDALVSILNVAKPRILVTTERVAKVLWSAVGRIPSIEKVLTTAELAKDAGALPAAADVRDDEVAFLQFTSGSTALPKGVMVTHGSLAANCAAIVRDGLCADGAHDVAVSWLPLYHDMGLIGFVIAPICFRIPAVFIATMSFIKNATIWLETLHKHRGTLTFAPNFAYALITKRARPEQIARWDLSRMRVFGCGAEPINPETMRAFVAAMAPAGVKSHRGASPDRPHRPRPVSPRPQGRARLRQRTLSRSGELRSHFSRPRAFRPGRRRPHPPRPPRRRGVPPGPERHRRLLGESGSHEGDIPRRVAADRRSRLSRRRPRLRLRPDQGHPHRQRAQLLPPAD
ncbi:MAG: fatty acyl-AMP ligase [Deltaproteobacteria bacterium]|nr:MAG: fatty acyl-AMP ligase [Deltaproteobacteria bacterium]